MDIPSHDCKGCGVIMLNNTDIMRITSCLNKMPLDKVQEVAGQKRTSLTCPLLNMETKRCLAYDARPHVCRIMGVAKGMTCQHGNSAEIEFPMPNAKEMRALRLLNPSFLREYVRTRGKKGK